MSGKCNVYSKKKVILKPATANRQSQTVTGQTNCRRTKMQKRSKYALSFFCFGGVLSPTSNRDIGSLLKKQKQILMMEIIA